ncbi:hypothetical protein [Frankia sp. CiP3]|uniref:hypothetical protein n=1 Tax=Frankia sp. CiP3 TaxID=2880971 RepID=UPI001EF6FD04|nr:hypothetical protein [Frankia sp. CiP3]
MTVADRPPVANLVAGSAAGLVEAVAEAPRSGAVASALASFFGFGGQNACLVLISLREM